jgi:hypothetical protein
MLSPWPSSPTAKVRHIWEFRIANQTRQKGRPAADHVHRCMNELRAIASDGGAYVSESNYFESDFERSYWGANRTRLAEIKKKYDPEGLFFVRNGIGSKEWSSDGFTKL